MYGDGGLVLRGRIWYTRLYVAGKEKRQSAGTTDRKVAERILRQRKSLVLNFAQQLNVLKSGLGNMRIGMLEGEEVIALRAPIVYVWFRGDQALYVGKGETGFCRPLNPTHHQLRAIEPKDRLKVWSCATSTEACQLERELIDSLKPPLNKETAGWRAAKAKAKRIRISCADSAASEGHEPIVSN